MVKTLGVGINMGGTLMYRYPRHSRGIDRILERQLTPWLAATHDWGLGPVFVHGTEKFVRVYLYIPGFTPVRNLRHSCPAALFKAPPGWGPGAGG
jgi:hypothetical protein